MHVLLVTMAVDPVPENIADPSLALIIHLFGNVPLGETPFTEATLAAQQDVVELQVVSDASVQEEVSTCAVVEHE